MRVKRVSIHTGSVNGILGVIVNGAPRMKPTQKFRQQMICYNMKKGGFSKVFDKLKDNE